MIKKDKLSLVVGPGAVGVCLASYLKDLGLSSCFWGRKGEFNQSVSFKRPRGIETFNPFSGSSNLFEYVDNVFFTVKAYDLEKAMSDVLPLLVGDPLIVVLSNGYYDSVVTPFRDNYPNYKWRLGFSTFGVSQVSEGLYKQESEKGAFLWYDPSSPLAPTLNAELESFLINHGASNFNILNPTIEERRFHKWLFNTVMNTLCGVKGYGKNIELLEDMKILKAVFEEAYMLSLEKKFNLGNYDKEEVWKSLLSFIRDVSDNENSMHRDIRLGRKTETHFLAGCASHNPEKYPLLCEMHLSLL